MIATTCILERALGELGGIEIPKRRLYDDLLFFFVDFLHQKDFLEKWGNADGLTETMMLMKESTKKTLF